MYRDALVDTAAKKNPLRWGRPMSVMKLAQELCMQDNFRPVRIYLEISDGKLEREFEGTDSAARWLCSKFDINLHLPSASPRAPSLRRRNSGLGFRSCRCRESQDTQEDEIVVDDSRDLHGAQDLATSESMEAVERNPSPSAAPSPVTTDIPSAAQLQFMWANAGLVSSLAEANPMRWTSLQSPRDIVTQLEGAPPRPVKLRITFPGHLESKTFETPSKAALWVRGTFSVPEEEVIDRKCVICLEADVSVMLMPCRHAVLCGDCADVILASSNKRCPVCRTNVGNHARGHFADEYVDLVQAMEARMERTQASLHEGMYNHLKPMMVTGVLLGTGAAACFVVAPPVAVALGGAALAVGYLPWFATTVSYLENEDLSSNQRLTARSFFSRDDLARPLTLIAKTLTMAVVAPVAALVFYIPYGLFAIARPAVKTLIRGLVRLSAFVHVYMNRPSARGLSRLSENLMNLLRDIGYGAYEHAVILGNLLASGARHVGDILLTIANHLHTAASTAALSTYDHVLCPVGRGIREAAAMTHRNVLQPFGTACYSAGSAVAYGTGVAAGRISSAAQRAAQLLGQGCMNLYSYVLLPGGRAALLVLQRTGDGLAAGAEAVYSYMLLPLGNGLAAVANAVGNGLAAGAHAVGNGLAKGADILYSNLLLPLGQGSLAVLQALGNGLSVAAGFLYRNALAPLGHGAWAILKALAYGSWVTLKTLGNGLAKGAQLTYSYVLVPCGHGAAIVAYGAYRAGGVFASALAEGAALTYHHALVPIGQAIARGARTVHVYILQPSAESLRSLANAIASGAAEGAQVVYIYVLQPSGHAIRVASVMVGDAISGCAHTVRDAAVSVKESGREAVTATVHAIRSARVF